MRAMMLILALAFTVTGCGDDEGALADSDERFIATMVELRRAALEAGSDTARYEDLRREILEDRGVTEDDLRSYVARHSGDLRHMATIWDTISARLSEPVPE